MFFIIFILPLLLAFFLFYPFEKHQVQITQPSINETNTIYLPSEEFTKPSFKNTIRKIFGTPFELTYYDLYFKDLGSSMISEKGEKIGDFAWEVNLSNKIYTVKHEPMKVNQLKIDTEYSTKLSYRFIVGSEDLKKMGPNYGGAMWFPRIDVYAKLSMWDAVGQAILFILAWLGAAALISNLLNQIKSKQ